MTVLLAWLPEADGLLTAIDCTAALKLFSDRISSCAEGAVVRGQKVTIGTLID
jgi:hypothetical protein